MRARGSGTFRYYDCLVYVHVNRVCVRQVREVIKEKSLSFDLPRSLRSEADLLRPRRRKGLAPVVASEPLEHEELASRRRLVALRDHQRKVVLRRVVRRRADDNALLRGVGAIGAGEENLV
jgi:hypothetical protein